MTATLWASRTDRRRIARARSAVLLVGGYDGSGNYGDVLQLAATLETVKRVPGSPLPIAVVERAHERHAQLLLRHPSLLGAAAFVHYQDGPGRRRDGLLELQSGAAPPRSATYLYGGGYLNHWWGARKVELVRAAERLASPRPLPLVASGLQVEEATVAPGGVAHELLARASWLGVRDPGSLECLRRHLPAESEARVELTGDDAIPALCPEPALDEPVVNLHMHEGEHVSDDPERTVDDLVALLTRIGRAAGPLRLQPVTAYEDPRVSETLQLAALLERRGVELESAGLTPATDPIDILEDVVDDSLIRFRRARLTISCSYHVALTSLLAGIPTILLSENPYYEQKAAGLRDLFALDRGLVGVSAADADAEAAAVVLLDGPSRNSLVEHLCARAEQLIERQEQGRATVVSELAAGLASVGPGGLRTAARRRLARLPRGPLRRRRAAAG